MAKVDAPTVRPESPIFLYYHPFDINLDSKNNTIVSITVLVMLIKHF